MTKNELRQKIAEDMTIDWRGDVGSTALLSARDLEPVTAQTLDFVGEGYYSRVYKNPVPPAKRKHDTAEVIDGSIYRVEYWNDERWAEIKSYYDNDGMTYVDGRGYKRIAPLPDERHSWRDPIIDYDARAFKTIIMDDDEEIINYIRAGGEAKEKIWYGCNCER